MAGRELTRRGAAGLMAASVIGAGAALAQKQAPAPPILAQRKGPRLRGATIAFRRRLPAVDGKWSRENGGGVLIPAYTGRDLNRLADWGANLVTFSLPGLFPPWAPYTLDEELGEAMDRLFDLAKAAGLQIVMGARTGPGRSEFAFQKSNPNPWFPKSLILESVWRNEEQQAAWVEMWRATAKLFGGRAEIAGFLPMVEPNGNETGLDKQGRVLNEWSPERLRARVSTLSDWSRICRPIQAAIAAEAPDKAVLISPEGYGRAAFAPLMGAPNVKHAVWCFHSYDPFDYSHQGRIGPAIAAPGEEAHRAFEQEISAAMARAPVFVGEMGVVRWAPGQAAFMQRRLEGLERLGAHWSLFRWPSSNPAYERHDDALSLALGPDPASLTEAAEGDWAKIVRAFWAKNEG